MNIVSCNYRGLGGSVKVEALKNIINTEKPDILLIQETKMPEDKFWADHPSSRNTASGKLSILEELQVEYQPSAKQTNSASNQQKKIPIGS